MNDDEELDNAPDLEGPTALITGASSGIGYELAKLFARDGFNLLIVARNESMLNIVSTELQNLGSPYVRIFARDLSVTGAVNEIYEEIELDGIQVDVLVNDAGVGEHGYFAEVEFEKDLHVIQLNIIALVQLTKLFLRDMLAKRNGQILQVASLSAYQPTPLLAVYAATKAFVLSFTNSLVNELKDTGVSITALIPDATDTDFFDAANATNTLAANQTLADPADVARAGYEALLKGKTHAIPGTGTKAKVALSQLLPNDALASIARKQMEEKV
jgi:uncharacterized protein